LKKLEENIQYRFNNRFKTLSKKILLILIWLSAVAFYMYTRMINTSLSAFSIPLINQYGFSSIDIAFAISIYSIAMLMMKIPVGVIVDRYGIDIPVMIAMAVVLIGTIIFAFPINSATLLASRFIIGVGTAFAMMSAYRLTSIILNKRLFRFYLFLWLVSSFYFRSSAKLCC